MQGTTKLLPTRAIRLPEVCTLTGMSQSTIWRKCRATGPYFDPQFPKPTHLSEMIVAWDEREVLDWIHSKQGNVVYLNERRK